MKFTSVLLAFIICAACALAQVSTSQPEKMHVAIDEIGKTVEVIGGFGAPLRKMTYFKAKWIPSTDHSKPEAIPLRLKIMEIDRVLVDRDVLFLPNDVVFVDSKGKEVAAHELTGLIDLFGYEDWVTYGPPAAFYGAIDGYLGGSPAAHGRTQLRAIVQSH